MNLLLSDKPIATQERLIFAIDTASLEQAKGWVNELGDSVCFYKIGMQFLMSGDYFPFIGWLKDRHKRVFVDLKFFDVPQTVRSAITGLLPYGVDLATIHGNQAMMEAASEAKQDLKVLAVTMLTSVDQADAYELGFKVDIEQLVVARARRALKSGCDGVVASGLEVRRLRQEIDHQLLVVCPGIRPFTNSDDQKRTVNVIQAFEKGADYIVVGRPISQPQQGTPRQIAEHIQAQINAIFSA